MTGWAVAGWAACCSALAAWTVTGPPVAAVRLSEHGSGPGRSDQVVARFRILGLTDLGLAVLRAPVERRRRVALWRTAVVSLCDGVAAELRAGRSPEAALAEAVSVIDPAVATALRGRPPGTSAAAAPDRRAERPESLSTALTTGGAAPEPVLPDREPLERQRSPEVDGRWPIGVDVPVLLERTSHHPGAEGLRLLAACWRIGSERGGTFASVVDGLADTLRQDEAHRQEIAAQLAGPRATARLLSGLPVLGLAMAAALGARPLSFLLGTLPGALCLITGIGLDLLGLWWTRRLADRAELPVGPRRGSGSGPRAGAAGAGPAAGGGGWA